MWAGVPFAGAKRKLKLNSEEETGETDVYKKEGPLLG